MEYNLNRQCKVTLTETGAKVMNEYYESIRHPLVVNKVYKSGDEVSTELWHVMKIFGEHLYLGCDVPFIDNVIEISEKA